MSEKSNSELVDRVLQQRADAKEQRKAHKETEHKAHKENLVINGAKLSYQTFTEYLRDLFEETQRKLGYEAEELTIKLGKVYGKVYFGRAVLGVRCHQDHKDLSDVRAFIIFGYRMGDLGQDVNIVTQREWIADADERGVFWRCYGERKSPEELAQSCFLRLVDMEAKQD